MRAKEFTINIPINIKMDDDQPMVATAPQPAAAPAAAAQPAAEPVDDNVGTFIPPLQQKIELLKIQRDEAIYSTHFCFHDEFFNKFDEQFKKEFGEV